MSLATGSKISLRRARPEDQERAFQWLLRSDPAPRSIGVGWYADRIPVDYAAFCNHFRSLVFDGTAPFAGRGYVFSVGAQDVGFVAHGAVNLMADVVELDIWLAGPALRGLGYGSDALAVLCDLLQRSHGVNRFLMRPSRRDVHSLRAMRRAGFRESDLEPADVIGKLALAPGWYGDEVVLFRILPLPPATLRRTPGRAYVFVDSEFTSLQNPHLISFAAVIDTDAAFYCELDDWDEAACSGFVRAQVLPMLGGERVARTAAAAAFLLWLRSQVAEAGPITLVSDSGFDRWAVYALLGDEELPAGVDWRRVTVAYEELDEACKRLRLRRHHALDDARALQHILRVDARR